MVDICCRSEHSAAVLVRTDVLKKIVGFKIVADVADHYILQRAKDGH